MDFSESISETDANIIFNRSLFNAGAKGPITPSSLIKEIRRFARELLKTPVSRYALLTSLSIKSDSQIKKIRIGRDQLIFGTVPLRFFKEAEPLIKNAKRRLLSDPPENYLPVRVHVSSRSIYEAADNALMHLDLIKAIWNLFYNRNQYARLSIGKKDPVNKITIGPIHTLHEPNGILSAKNVWWYEPSYVKPSKIHDISQETNQLDDFTLKIRARLSKIKYAPVIEDALRRYGNSLDQRDWNNAFFRLWGILELLTNTSPQDNYQVTIRRAAYIFHERDYYYQVLNQLRHYRNRYIHHDYSNSHIENYMYQLKLIVEAVIIFHLNNNLGFSSIQEVGDFLNLPYKREILESREK